MRKFLNVSKQRQKELETQFPNLIDLVQVNETKEYTYLAVSIFDQWSEQQSKDVINAPYYHLVFTLPHELNGLARQYPREIYSCLFHAVWRGVKKSYLFAVKALAVVFRAKC